MSQGTTELRGGVLRLLDSPIRFMEARMAADARLLPALVPVALNAALLAGINALGTSRTTVIGLDGEAVAAPTTPVELMIPLAVIGGLIAFTVRAGAVVGIDAVAAQSGKGRRLVEFAGLAYWTQVLWAVPAFAAMWWLYDPPPMVVEGQGLDMMQAALRYGEELAAEPLQITMTRTQQMFGLWLVGLHAAALRVVSGLTTRGAWTAAAVMALVFMGVPLAAGQVIQSLVS